MNHKSGVTRDGGVQGKHHNLLPWEIEIPYSFKIYLCITIKGKAFCKITFSNFCILTLYVLNRKFLRTRLCWSFNKRQEQEVLACVAALITTLLVYQSSNIKVPQGRRPETAMENLSHPKNPITSPAKEKYSNILKT
ncbi:hypothetical protein NQ317_010848 [Molorchus minor]|uniref:Uncharacterized protein n=1 Tax=Molorchus minor TaxID=1323400 RepID=A0ABQ9JZ78_9CUCU|nr:hypothetical protein NQ317_010848 [Molorchus minor]